MNRPMFHQMMQHARAEIALARDFRDHGQPVLASDYLAQACARRRAAHGYRKGGEL